MANKGVMVHLEQLVQPGLSVKQDHRVSQAHRVRMELQDPQDQQEPLVRLDLLVTPALQGLLGSVSLGVVGLLAPLDQMDSPVPKDPQVLVGRQGQTEVQDRRDLLGQQGLMDNQELQDLPVRMDPQDSRDP